MSLPRKVKGTCPQCATELEFTIWKNINTEVMPDVSQKIISGEFFSHKCPKCGFISNLEYSTLYRDPMKRIAIWVINKDEHYDALMETVQETMHLFKGYTGRIVHSTSQLREKVGMFEAGRDDRVIEFLKLILQDRLQNACPDFQVDRSFYLVSAHAECVEFFDTENDAKGYMLDETLYQKAFQLLFPLLQEDETSCFIVVDQAWAQSVRSTLDSYLDCSNAKEKTAAEQPPPPLYSAPKAVPAVNGCVLPSVSSAQFCWNCGEKLFDNSRFCHKCGSEAAAAYPPSSAAAQPPAPFVSSPQANPAPDTSNAEPPKKKSGRIIPVLVALAVLAGALLGTQNYWKAALLYDITFNGDAEFSLQVGDSHKISYSADIGTLTADDIEWNSSDHTVATVSDKGVILAKGEGLATITASINGVKKDSCMVYVTLKVVPVKNGEIIKRPRWTDYPEVTVNAPLNENCFVYFKNTKNSAKDFAFYVKAGSSATVNAPTGTYILYYASGKNWYGPDLKFGQGSSFYKSPDPITLEEDETSYDVLELTLYAVVDGNMDTDPIDESEFPM